MTTRIVTDANGRKHITNEPLLHPPQRKPLTDDDMEQIAKKFSGSLASLVRCLREVEAAHGIQE